MPAPTLRTTRWPTKPRPSGIITLTAPCRPSRPKSDRPTMTDTTRPLSSLPADSPLGQALAQPLLLGLFLPIHNGGWTMSTLPRDTDWSFDYNAALTRHAEPYRQGSLGPEYRDRFSQGRMGHVRPTTDRPRRTLSGRQ